MLAVAVIAAGVTAVYFAKCDSERDGTTTDGAVHVKNAPEVNALSEVQISWSPEPQGLAVPAFTTVQIDSHLQIDAKSLLGEPITVATVPRNPVAAPVKKNLIAPPVKEDLTTSPVKRNLTAAPIKKNLTVAPVKENLTATLSTNSSAAQPVRRSVSEGGSAKAEAIQLSPLAVHHQKYSSDAKIIAALNVLKEINAKEIFDNLDIMNAEIKLYDFELLGYEYRKHYALNTKKNGKTIIAINSRYENSPAEAIASLIVHESFHKMKIATLDEEVFCTMMEAKYWKILKVPGKHYSDNDVLVFKLDNWVVMYASITKDYNPIRTKIANSAFYKDRLA